MYSQSKILNIDSDDGASRSYGHIWFGIAGLISHPSCNIYDVLNDPEHNRMVRMREVRIEVSQPYQISDIAQNKLPRICAYLAQSGPVSQVSPVS